jgi:hypothetical protein
VGQGAQAASICTQLGRRAGSCPLSLAGNPASFTRFPSHLSSGSHPSASLVLTQHLQSLPCPVRDTHSFRDEDVDMAGDHYFASRAEYRRALRSPKMLASGQLCHQSPGRLPLHQHWSCQQDAWQALGSLSSSGIE